MANYANLIQQINASIKTNGANLITGQMLQTILDNMVASLGAKYQYAGVATPATNPGTPDQNVFYLAATAGTYTNFGGLVVAEGEVAALKYNGAWTKDTTGVATAAQVNQLGQQVIYDVTKNNPTSGPNNDGKFESLSALLLDANLSTLIPIAVRCGGMSIRFVQSSDNKYVQFRCIADEFTTDVTQWAIADEGVYVENPEFIEVHLDADDKFLWGIRRDGKVEYGAGIPTVISEELSKKVDKELGKGLIDLVIANCFSFVNNAKWLDIRLDSNNNILWGIKRNGEVYIPILESPSIDSKIQKVYKDTYEEFNKIKGSISTLNNRVFPKGVKLTIEGNLLTFVSNRKQLQCYKHGDKNGVFNYYLRTVNNATSGAGDDVAPIHIALKENGGVTTIGANHGWLMTSQATIENHGKTNVDIGTLWTDSQNKVYVLAEIVDENTILFLSQNQGDRIDMDFYSAMTVGTIIKGTDSMTVSAVISPQLHNSVGNVTLQIFDSTGNRLTEDGVYEAEYFDVVESYGITNPADIVSNLIARQSESPIPTDDPVFEGQSMLDIHNIYRIGYDTNVIVTETVIPKQKVYLNNGDIMFSQSQYLISGNNNIKYYVPGSKPTQDFNLTVPTIVNWSSSIPYFYANEDSFADQNKPINRIIQYSQYYGFVLGYMNYAGVGKNIMQYTTTPLEKYIHTV